MENLAVSLGWYTAGFIGDTCETYCSVCAGILGPVHVLSAACAGVLGLFCVCGFSPRLD